MKKFDVEVIVGLFVLMGILCMTYISIHLGKVEFFENDYYPLQATFSSVTGLNPDTDVEIAGVSIGKVERIELDNNRAVVHLLIRNNIKIQEDAIAAIQTKGILGEQYIQIKPGGSDIILQPGEAIFDTEPPFDLISAIKSFVVEQD